MTSHWLFQTSMFNIELMVAHLYVECIVCFSNILFLAFYSFDDIYLSSFITNICGFYWLWFPSDWGLKSLFWLEVVTGFATNLLAPGISPVRSFLFLCKLSDTNNILKWSGCWYATREGFLTTNCLSFFEMLRMDECFCGMLLRGGRPKWYIGYYQ